MPTLFQRVRNGPGFLSGLALIFAALPLPASDKNPVIVHEWGTFTSLQDENGQAIGGINVDDEPVPGFVCQYANRMVAGQYSPDSENFGLPPYNADGGKGWTPCDPDVTMRLETPVIYIYPPKGQTAQSVPPLDVHVDFHGGVLSQFYPYAQTNGADGIGDVPYLRNPNITSSMTTGLTWKGVRLGVDGKPFPPRNDNEKNAPGIRGAVVEINDPVWTTPRETAAPLLGVKFTQDDFAHPGKKIDYAETEHFLFYRGVGHLDSPVVLQDCGGQGILSVLSPARKLKGLPYEPGIDRLDEGWMVEIRPDGSCAFRNTPVTRGLLYSGGHIGFSGSISDRFVDSDFSTANIDQLKASMQAQLIKQGLYPDEASAMLRTWELSYFKSPGLRFFYIAPNAWVNRVLPLQVTGAPVKITRVMIGRIELISATQKQALARLAAGPTPDLNAVKSAARTALNSGKYNYAQQMEFYSGRKPLRDLGIPIPPLVQDYLDLGRFRDALVLREEKLRPTNALAQFIKQNQIGSVATTNDPAQADTVASTH